MKCCRRYHIDRLCKSLLRITNVYVNVTWNTTQDKKIDFTNYQILDMNNKCLCECCMQCCRR